MSGSKKVSKSAKSSSVRPKATKGGSWVLCLAWSFILGWCFFLVYCWQSGHLHANIKTLEIVEEAIISTENSLRGSLEHIHIASPAVHHISTDVLNNHEHNDIPDPDNTPEPSDIHVIFSTDCNPYQDWQSLLLFYSAVTIGQKGPITRIASGCDEDKKVELTALYKKLYPNYHVHFTPDFKKDEKTQKSYDFYNKPWGLRHWLDNADPPVGDEVVVALLDPDMIFVRPLTTKIRGQPNNLHAKNLKESDLWGKVEEGKPAAQLYGLGAPWTNDKHAKFNRLKICGEGSPCLEPKPAFGEAHYSVGPPYLVHRKDMEKIAESWTTFVPRVYEGYPYLLAEMYAYSMAAAHENLPHLQMEHYMVSNTDSPGEGWPLIDRLNDACRPPVDGIYFSGTPLPTVVHYCQSFRAGAFGFAKRQAPKNMFSCESPMFADLPNDLDKINWRNKDGKIEVLKPEQAKRNGFTLCVLHRSLNAALTDYKKRMCDPATQFVNYNKTINVLAKG